MFKFSSFLAISLLILSSCLPFYAQADDNPGPTLDQMDAGQIIRVVKDIKIAAGSDNVGTGSDADGGVFCGFAFKPTVIDRKIKAGTTLRVLAAYSWDKPGSSVWSGGTDTITTSSDDMGTKVELSQIAGFQQLSFYCTQPDVDYLSVKKAFPELQFP